MPPRPDAGAPAARRAQTRYQTFHHGEGTSYGQVIRGVVASRVDRLRIAQALGPMLTRAVVAHAASFYAVQLFKRWVLPPPTTAAV